MGRRQHKGKHSKSQPRGVRIIGGKFRGSRLEVPDLPGLRPSGDRVRETLFNWLQPWMEGARCLDLFAGTGVLGLEAESRGASQVVLVESNRQAARAIESNVSRLKSGAEVVCRDARQWLDEDHGEFHLVFVDPPFEAELQGPILEQLLDSSCLTSYAWIYVETPSDQSITIPPRLNEEKCKRIGAIEMRLLRCAQGEQKPQA